MYIYKDKYKILQNVSEFKDVPKDVTNYVNLDTIMHIDMKNGDFYDKDTNEVVYVEEEDGEIVVRIGGNKNNANSKVTNDTKYTQIKTIYQNL